MQIEINVRAEEISLALFGLSVTIWSGLLTMRRRMGPFTQCTSGRVFKAYYLRQGRNLDTFLKVIWVWIANCSLDIKMKCLGNIYGYFL